MNKTTRTQQETPSAHAGDRVFDGDQVAIGTVTQVRPGRLRVRSLFRDFWLSTEHISRADGSGVWLSLPEILVAAELPPLPH
ncbi:MAG: hypothetical protein ACRDG3_10620, partial [Tepidiformaceae bacterium]